MSLDDVELNYAIVEANSDMCRMTVGIHLYNAKTIEKPSVSEGLHEKAKTTYAKGAVKAFGELGLDYECLARVDRPMQMKCFRQQLDWFVESGLDLPLFLHCRKSFPDFVGVIKLYLNQMP